MIKQSTKLSKQAEELARKGEEQKITTFLNQLKKKYNAAVHNYKGNENFNSSEAWTNFWDEFANKTTFAETMKLFGTTNTSKFGSLLTELHVYLATSNYPWKVWFFDDCADICEDLDYKRELLPIVKVPQWMLNSMENVKTDDHRQNKEDNMFKHVPWRCFYMWCRMFRKMCTIHLAELFQIYSYHEILHMNNPKEPCKFTYSNSSDYLMGDMIVIPSKYDKKVLMIDIRNGMPSRELHVATMSAHCDCRDTICDIIDEDDSEDHPESPIFYLWIMTKVFIEQEFSRHPTTAKVEFPFTEGSGHPYRITQHKKELEYSFNFDVSDMVAFVVWYVQRMIDLNKFEDDFSETDPTYIPSAMRLCIKDHLKRIKVIRFQDAFKDVDYMDYLSHLPLVPRKFTKDGKEPEYLGNRI